MNYQKKFQKNKELSRFIKDCDKLNPEKDKKGFETGLFVNHPFIEGKIAIYVANFVLKDMVLAQFLVANS